MIQESNLHSKAYDSQLNLQHGTKKQKNKGKKQKKQYAQKKWFN